MPHSVQDPAALEPPEAKRELVRLAEKRLLEASRDFRGETVLIRVDVPAARMDATAWLRAQNSATKAYWAGRDTCMEWACVGTADLVSGNDTDAGSVIARLESRLAQAQAEMRYFGGVAFDPSREPGGYWEGMPTCRFVLPRFEFVIDGACARLACNMALSAASEADAELDLVMRELEDLAFPEPGATPQVPEMISRMDSPSRTGWNAMVAKALKEFAEGALEKVVLARETVFGFAGPLDASALLQRLAAVSPGTYRFFFQFSDDAAFVGASPERLYARTGRAIHSEALAGTRPRGVSTEKDNALGAELLRSDKERREHGFVLDAVREAFEGLCSSVGIATEPVLMKLPACQHMLREVEGVLADEVSDADIVRALHPTPAVGGYPRRDAMGLLTALEPFGRGWYAGPVGWIGRDAAEFAVAIRSGLVRGDTLTLYSGAGIVVGSTAEREWREVETKIGGFLGVLTGRDEQND